jgi:hypothetical protein
MLVIQHRVNSIEQLKLIPANRGIEVDVHMEGNDLVTGHDPGESLAIFEEWLKSYRHSLLAINIKQEGIESKIIKLLSDRNISDFFLFDLSFPMLYKTQLLGESRLAIRVSDLEPFQSVHHFRGRVEWIWLDGFLDLKFLKQAKFSFNGFKVCFVSPELHQAREKQQVEDMLKDFRRSSIIVDAICTKNPEQWEEQK